MSQPCQVCRLFRVFLLGAGGALLGAWLGPQLGFAANDQLTPGIAGALLALALGAWLFGPRR